MEKLKTNWFRWVVMALVIALRVHASRHVGFKPVGLDRPNLGRPTHSNDTFLPMLPPVMPPGYTPATSPDPGLVKVIRPYRPIDEATMRRFTDSIHRAEGEPTLDTVPIDLTPVPESEAATSPK